MKIAKNCLNFIKKLYSLQANSSIRRVNKVLRLFHFPPTLLRCAVPHLSLMREEFC